MTSRTSTIALAPTVLLLAGGCVERQLTVTSEPAGALVYLNHREAGRTPFTADFTFYGTYDVVVRAEGHETLVTKKRVVAPWWQWVPFDLVAELMPWRPTDRQAMAFTLEPREPASAGATRELIDRGAELREAMNEVRSP